MICEMLLFLGQHPTAPKLNVLLRERKASEFDWDGEILRESEWHLVSISLPRMPKLILKDGRFKMRFETKLCLIGLGLVWEPLTAHAAGEAFYLYWLALLISSVRRLQFIVTGLMQLAGPIKTYSARCGRFPTSVLM